MHTDPYDIPGLIRTLGRPIEYFDRISSTSDYAIARAQSGAPERTVVLADEQTAGRGRRGRRWDSTPGCGLWMSVLLRPEGTPADLPPLTLCAGYAVALAIEDITGLSPRIKWPNDILIDGRKLSGVLSEAQTAGQETAIVLGIGINVHHEPEDFPSDLRAVATSLYIETQRRFSRGVLLHSLLTRLDMLYHRFLRFGIKELLPDIIARLAWMGDPVDIVTGPECMRGVIAGLDHDGSLLIDTPDRGRVQVHSGVIRPLKNQFVKKPLHF